MHAYIQTARENRRAREQLRDQYPSRRLIAGPSGIAPAPIASLQTLDRLAHDLTPQVDLEDCFLVASMHLLLDSDAVLRKLEGWGLDPRCAVVYGKPYSTNLAVVAALLERGYTVHASSYAMDAEIPLGRSVEAMAHDALVEIFARWDRAGSGRRIVLADDGGTLIRVALACFGDRVGTLAAVEHTSRGIFELEHTVLPIPTVNVARSWAKLQFESGYIGESVDAHLEQRIGGLDPNASALVVGCGAIGAAVAACLRARGLEVLTYDPAVCASSEPYERLLSRADLVFGCTGRTSLDRPHWPYIKPGAMLVSCSSLDHEFAAWKLRVRPQSRAVAVVSDDGLHRGTVGGRPIFLGDPDDPAHYWYCVEIEPDRTVHVLNGGCPINFSGAGISMPHAKSELTVSLLLAGIAQASAERQVGLVPLDRAVQERMVSLHNSHVRREPAGRGDTAPPP